MTIGTISVIGGVVLLILLRIFLRDEGELDQNEEEGDVNDAVKEDPWSDPGWSTLTGNLFNNDEK